MPTSSNETMSPVNDVPSANEKVSARVEINNPQSQMLKTIHRILRTHCVVANPSAARKEIQTPGSLTDGDALPAALFQPSRRAVRPGFCL